MTERSPIIGPEMPCPECKTRLPPWDETADDELIYRCGPCNIIWFPSAAALPAELADA